MFVVVVVVVVIVVVFFVVVVDIIDRAPIPKQVAIAYLYVSIHHQHLR